MKAKVINFMMALMALLAFSCSSDDVWNDDEEIVSSDDDSGSSSSGEVTTTGGDLSSMTIEIDSTTALSETVPTDADDEDLVANSSFASTIKIAYDGSTASVSGSADGVTITQSGADVTVNSSVSGVEYVLSGTTTDGSFKIYSSKKFKVTLNGVNITNSDGPAINSQSSKRMFVVLADGTFNSLTDGSSYADSDEDQKGTLFAEGKVIVSGAGKLRVYANAKAGISADDYVRILPTTNIYVKSTSGNGIKANDDVTIDGGIINIETSDVASKGISSDGTVNVNGGRTTVITTGGGEYDEDEEDASACAGVKADSTFTISGGELYCKSTGTGGKGISGDQVMNFNDGTVKVITTGRTYTYNSSLDSKAKGIKADGNLNISGGSIMVKTTGGDGSEGIESEGVMTIEGGTVEVQSYDDALNSAGHMYVKGGYIYAYSTNNDGIDANGNLYFQGGVSLAYGTSSPEGGIDANEEGGYSVIITGGTVVSLGGDTSYPSQSSSQPSIVYRGSMSNGTTLALNSSSSNVLALTLGRSYSGTLTILMSSPSLSKGSSYTLYSGASASGTSWHGLITSATLNSTGSSIASISSLSSPYSSIGSAAGGGGMNPGGGRGW